MHDKVDNRLQTLAGFQIGKHKRTLTAHAFAIGFHDLQRRAHIRREVDFINHQQVRTGNAGAAFARDFFTFRHINHVNH